jgi:hypothetical protein
MDERQRRVDAFNAGAAGREEETSYERERRSRTRALFGAKDIEALFPRGSAPVTTVPFPGAGRRKREPLFSREAVHEELRRPARLVDIDPRILSASQPGITRAGIAHYLGEEYEHLGRTFAEQHNVGNQFPFVVTRRRSGMDLAEHVLIAGHHRATAALLQGRRLPSRWIEQ